MPQPDTRGKRNEYPGERIRKPRNRTMEDITTGLTALALHHGSGSAAAKWLNETGQLKKVTGQTLEDWAGVKHVELYTTIREQYLPEIRRRQVHRIESVITQAVDGAEEALAHARTNLDDVPGDRAARAAKDMATVVGIFNQNALLLRGEPTENVKVSVDMDELWTRLGQLVGSVEGSAIEVQNAESPELVEASEPKAA